MDSFFCQYVLPKNHGNDTQSSSPGETKQQPPPFRQDIVSSRDGGMVTVATVKIHPAALDKRQKTW